MVLGDQTEITEEDRLRVENRQLQERVRELEGELERYRRLEASLQTMTRRLERGR